MEFICGTEEDTLRLGRLLGRRLRRGDTVLLHGEMGAGKSVLARGIAAGLGISGPIPSPTFTILNIHEGEGCRLYHFDFYRLSGADELFAVGLDEYIPPEDGITVIEWPELAAEALPPECVSVTITPCGAARSVRVEPSARMTEEELNRTEEEFAGRA